MFSLILIEFVTAAIVVWVIVDKKTVNLTLKNHIDQIFENKNKKYGAYSIRKEYDQSLLISMLLCFGGVGIFLLLTAFATTGENKPIKTPNITSVLYEVQPDTPNQIETKTVINDSPKKSETSQEDTEPVVVDKTERVEPKAIPNETPAVPSTGGGAFKSGIDEVPGGTEAGVETTPKNGFEVEFMPEFPGGLDALQKYLSSNINYPGFEQEQEIQGVVIISFVVNTEGQILQVKELKGVKSGPNLTQEAIRVIKKMPRWKPGKANGKDVSVIFNLPVRFTLK